jgi:hypothetical protein
MDVTFVDIRIGHAGGNISLLQVIFLLSFGTLSSYHDCQTPLFSQQNGTRHQTVYCIYGQTPAHRRALEVKSPTAIGNSGRHQGNGTNAAWKFSGHCLR